MTIGDWLVFTQLTFKRSNIQSARLDAILLLCSVINTNKAWVLAHQDYVLSENDLSRLHHLTNRRANNEPIAYILGEKEFYGRPFRVTPDVLIPRPESEAFIELLCHIDPKPEQVLLDVGTGSGCLAITASLEFKKLRVLGIDISARALAVAQENARKLGASVTFLQSDLLADVSVSADYVIANLPYVPRSMSVTKDVEREPDFAIFADRQGLELITQLAAQAIKRLNNKGYILLESLEVQHDRIQTIYEKAGFGLVQISGLVQVFQKKS